MKLDMIQNYPNPFNSFTSISYQVPKKDHVEIFIYNLTGQRVRTLVNDGQLPGVYSTTWDGLDDTGLQSSSGVYFCTMKVSNFIQARKLILMQ